MSLAEPTADLSDHRLCQNEKANLSKPEQAAAVEMSKALVAKYGDAT